MNILIFITLGELIAMNYHPDFFIEETYSININNECSIEYFLN